MSTRPAPGTGRLASDVDEVRARRVQRDPVVDSVVQVQEPAAVGEGVGRDVEDAQHHTPPGPGQVDAGLAPMRRVHFCRISAIASARDEAEVWNSPRTADVVVREPGLRIPRIAMHRCSASITTITPCGSIFFTSASAT